MKCFITRIQQQYIYSMIVGFQLEGISIGCAKSLLSKIFESAYQYKWVNFVIKKCNAYTQFMYKYSLYFKAPTNTIFHRNYLRDCQKLRFF